MNHSTLSDALCILFGLLGFACVLHGFPSIRLFSKTEQHNHKHYHYKKEKETKDEE